MITMKKQYKLLALDIDGTLTNSDKEVTEDTRDAIIALQETGVKVMLASGRSEYGLLALAKELKLADYGSYIMSFNGGRIIRCSDMQIVYDKPLTFEEGNSIYATAVELGLGILGYEENALVSGNGTDRFQEMDARICNMVLKPIDNFETYFTKPYNKCLLTGEPELIDEVFPKVTEIHGKDLYVTRSADFFLDIMPKGIDKGSAMAKLCEIEGLDPSEIICVGDELNDLTMVEFAGLGVAMGNACKELLDIADYITDTNDNEGVLKLINHIFS